MGELLTALDVANQEFGKAFRGYDQEQVDDFLDQVSATLHIMAEKIKEQEHAIEQLHAQLKESHGLKDSLQGTLLMAQRSAEDRIAAAEQQAGAIVAEAQSRAERLLSEGRTQAESYRREVEQLRSVRRQMAAELKGVISRFESLISAGDPAGEEAR